jgi:hypothetical protein
MIITISITQIILFQIFFMLTYYNLTSGFSDHPAGCLIIQIFMVVIYILSIILVQYLDI